MVNDSNRSMEHLIFLINIENFIIEVNPLVGGTTKYSIICTTEIAKDDFYGFNTWTDNKAIMMFKFFVQA